MTKTRHYVPVISRSLVRVLYHEGKRQHMPMTRIATAPILAAYIFDGTTYPLRARHLATGRRGALP